MPTLTPLPGPLTLRARRRPTGGNAGNRTATATDSGSSSGGPVAGPALLEATVHLREYGSERSLPDVMRLVDKDLSEPYSVFTYRYFLKNWPEHAILAQVATPGAADEGGENGDDAAMTTIGVIVCRLLPDPTMPTGYMNKTGYIAMLAVSEEYRGLGIGSLLVEWACRRMRDDGAGEITLEAEASNGGALRLYERMGFARDELLSRYYLNGGDAFRLRLWIADSPQEVEGSAASAQPEEELKREDVVAS